MVVMADHAIRLTSRTTVKLLLCFDSFFSPPLPPAFFFLSSKTGHGYRGSIDPRSHENETFSFLFSFFFKIADTNRYPLHDWCSGSPSIKSESCCVRLTKPGPCKGIQNNRQLRQAAVVIVSPCVPTLPMARIT